MIFIDSNIPMYLVGQAHPQKVDAQRLLDRCVADGERLVTDVEVPQEILHRYAAIERRDMIQIAFDALLGVVDEVLPVELRDVERAKTLVLGVTRLSARDALRAAVMERHAIGRVLSFDTDFDAVPGLVRLHR
ncbi:MAG: type II toxin-antitoxin system VapC family toxin [Deltaproteobacteria bacterium]|nr:type II toxin-antitoxin system VapC family toxin [Deltaproteobacteria bacterium]